MTDERFDLSPLDPQEDARFEKMVSTITARARFELARRAAARRQSIVELVGGWARPALVAAASIAIVSVATLAKVDRHATAANGTAYISTTEVPAAVGEWYEEARDPTAVDLLVASSEGDN